MAGPLSACHLLFNIQSQKALFYVTIIIMDKTTSTKTNLLLDIIEELKKVTWPTRASTAKLTLTVLIISLIVGAYLGIIDVFLAKGLEALTKR